MKMQRIGQTARVATFVIGLSSIHAAFSATMAFCEESPQKVMTVERVKGYAEGINYAIWQASVLAEKELESRPGGFISSELENLIINLYDEFYLIVHALYTHENYGIYTQQVLFQYFGFLEEMISQTGRDSIKKLITLDEVAAKKAKKFASMRYTPRR